MRFDARDPGADEEGKALPEDLGEGGGENRLLGELLVFTFLRPSAATDPIVFLCRESCSLGFAIPNMGS